MPTSLADLPFAVAAIAAFIFGLIIGSFLNVVIHRVPREQSIVKPGSHCPACGAAVRAFDNIPLLSFVLLGGRCRQCRARIAFLYPLVEFLTGLVFLLIISKTGPRWEAGLEMAFAATMIALIFIDWRHQLLPNVIIYPALVLALAANALRAGWGEPLSYPLDLSIIFTAAETQFPLWRAAIVGGAVLAVAAPSLLLLEHLDLRLYDKYFVAERDEPELAVTDNVAVADEIDEEAAERRYRRAIYSTLVIGLLLGVAWAAAVLLIAPSDPQPFEQAYDGLIRALIGALIGGAPLWWIRAVYFVARRREGMGLGDIKLMALIGAFLGWQGALSVLLFGSISGALLGAVVMWRNRTGSRTALPFGACLGATAVLVLLFSTSFLH
jgi:prepilin signal peptidase PulO-like enzyme (type II secretory pathway)